MKKITVEYDHKRMAAIAKAIGPFIRNEDEADYCTSFIIAMVATTVIDDVPDLREV
ncbi:hypothetical protein GRI62_11755 [Erythrobacter arachoides]|uniref:Uncharacterized protein n=1 Tax=Aurantiacibacter arachoides TaxID=1850444 RepID=A0A845A3Q0_9SPHN|nr:hypothetical protein [Aurantiacibacter arachoides]MXO94270.1 hypothetical protein [Aurantiacibacter arachoides]GGD64816.1 hypothetical protein GCM10011411_26380 [Aurantiacibacter arachoides]